MASDRGSRILENRDIRTKASQFSTLAEWQEGKVEDIPAVPTADERLEAYLGGGKMDFPELGECIRTTENRALASRVLDSLDTGSMDIKDCMGFLRWAKSPKNGADLSPVQERLVSVLTRGPVYAEDVCTFCGRGRILEGYASGLLPFVEGIDDDAEVRREIAGALSGTPDEGLIRV